MDLIKISFNLLTVGKVKDDNNILDDDGHIDKVLIYDGEYKNGKRNGKGKEYNDTGDLMYEGDYINNEQNGEGKLYSPFGLLEYEGEFKDGLRHGKGTEFHFNKVIYDGEYQFGERVE